MAKIKKNTHKVLYRKYSSNIKYIMMALSVLIITVYLPKQPRFRFEYEKGKVWMHKDLTSPYSFAVLKTQDQIQSDKAAVLKNILPIYQLDKKVVAIEMEEFANEFEVKWKANNFKENDKTKNKKIAQTLLGQVYQKGIMGLTKRFQREGKDYNFTLLDANVSQKLSTQDVYTIESALAFLKSQYTNTDLATYNFVINLLEDHLQPNISFDERLTTKIENEALNSISTTKGMVQKGELLVAKNNIIDADIYQKLESLKSAYEEQAKIIGDKKLVFIGQLVLVGFIITLLIVFLFLFRKDIFHDDRQLSLILLVVTGMLVSLSWAIKFNLPSLYYIPYCIVPIIIRILFDTRLALNIHLLVVLVAGYFVPNSFEFTFYQVTAGMVAIYSIKNFVKRERFLVSAVFVLGAYLTSFIGIALVRDGSLTKIDWLSFVPFVFSVLLSLLAYPLIYLFERLFGITSDVTLMELTNTNSKLLRDLAYKAPGTFQHSLQVANLAEAAIFKIGGNSLLVRAGALYHDIGKIENPQYFIENQNKGSNPHDKLPYEQSAQIIIQHVNKGVEIARKHKLPEIVIDFIRTHHGNTRVDYFYHSFLKNTPEKLVDENIFRYPGPVPFSKETAVLMLADSAEAASRSLKNPDAQNINDLVERIIDYKLEQDQLNDSDITLKDIETIKLIFKTMLMGIYHVRIDYMEQG